MREGTPFRKSHEENGISFDSNEYQKQGDPQNTPQPSRNISQYFDSSDDEYDDIIGSRQEQHDHESGGKRYGTTTTVCQEDNLNGAEQMAIEGIVQRPQGTSQGEESIYFDPFEDEVLPREENPTPRERLSSLGLSVLVFYNVSGGPFGIEPAVKAGGPFYAILGFLSFPFIWSIPEALITAELGTAFPEPSGGVAWVEEAFGTKAGMISGYLSWISGATDNAIYPALFLQYLVSIVGVEGDDSSDLQSEWMRFLFTISMTFVLAWINYRGLEIVGNLSIIVCVISMSPFFLLCLIGMFQIQPSRWLQKPVDPFSVAMDDDGLRSGTGFFPAPIYGGVLWRPLLNNLFWNLNSFDSAGSFAGEIANSGEVFPRAVALGVVFVVLGYLIPLVVALGATDTNQEEWNEGYLASICTEIGGPWLGGWVVLAAGISNLALFEAEMSSDAFTLMGMARRGLLPKIFCAQSIYGTPTFGILLGTIIIVLLSMADFSALVEMLNFAYSLSLIMEYAAFIKLRISRPEVPRPYRIPLNTVGCIALLTPPVITTLLLMAYATKMTYIYISLVVLLGAFLHHLQKLARRNGWCEYVHVGDEPVGCDHILPAVI